MSVQSTQSKQNGEKGSTYNHKRVIAGNVGRVKGASDRRQDLGAEGWVGSGILHGLSDLLKRFADTEFHMIVGSTMLAKREEHIKSSTTGLEDCAHVHGNGRLERLNDSYEKVIRVLQRIKIQSTQITLDGLEDVALVLGLKGGSEEAIHGLDAANLNKFRVRGSNSLDGLFKETVRRAVSGLAECSSSEETSGTQDRRLCPGDGVLNDFSIRASDLDGDGLLTIQKVVQSGVEQVEGSLLLTPVVGVVTKEGLGNLIQALEDLGSEPFAKLDNNIAAGRPGSVVGADTRLFGKEQRNINVPQTLLLHSDLRERDQQLVELHDPIDLGHVRLGLDIGLKVLLYRAGTQALVEEVKLVKNQEVEGVGETIAVFQAALDFVVDEQVLVRALKSRQLLPDGAEEGGTVGKKQRGENGLDLDQGLDNLDLECDGTVPALRLGTGLFAVRKW